LDQVLDLILKINNLDKVLEGNVIRGRHRGQDPSGT